MTEIKDNSVYLRNKRTGEVVMLVWQNEERPEYMNYMTVNGVKSIKYSAVTDRKGKEISLATMKYAESIGLVRFETR